MSNPNQNVSRFSCVLAYLSFVPIVGVFLVPIVVVWGLVKWRKNGRSLIYIGMGGLLFNLVFGTGLTYFVGSQRDALHDDKHVKHLLPEIVESIESFKSYEGAYPKTLTVFNWESTKAGEMRLPKDIIERLHYEVIEGSNNYFLLGIGADNTPFTADDILPAFDESSSEQIGLIVKGVSN